MEIIGKDNHFNEAITLLPEVLKEQEKIELIMRNQLN